MHTTQDWQKACQELARDITTPEDVAGWLINVNDVADAMPEDIRKHGCAQSPMEMIPRLVDQRDDLRSLLQQMLDVAENADETGYVADVGFVDLDKLHAEVRAALKS